ncbi:MBL fold metallo-hydrolase, partial [Parabacteroides sp. OttesenSCG-928-G06]|nr:MBL fold metallo-hydrolase [Parabacteroides sp. OttesenSCG-928-G06]
YADGGAMFGAIPKTAWKRRYPSDENNACVLAMRSLLVETDEGRIVLIDNGAGAKQTKDLTYYRFFDCIDLEEELLKRGIRLEDVTDVVLTHLHFDHCGNTTRLSLSDEYVSTFPNARHWVSRRQWENFLHPHPLERDSYFPENMQAIADAGLLQLIDAETQLCSSIHLRLYDGHTSGQIVPYINTGKETLVFAGDVIPLAASISPAWISAYDTHPLTSWHEKTCLLDEAAREKQTIIFCHDAYTSMCRVKKSGGGYSRCL